MNNLFTEIVNFMDDIQYLSLYDSLNKSDRFLWLGILFILFSFMLIPIAL